MVTHFLGETFKPVEERIRGGKQWGVVMDAARLSDEKAFIACGISSYWELETIE